MGDAASRAEHTDVTAAASRAEHTDVTATGPFGREDRLEGRTVWKGGPLEGKTVWRVGERESVKKRAPRVEKLRRWACKGQQQWAAAVALQKGVQAGPRWAVPQEAQQCR